MTKRLNQKTSFLSARKLDMKYKSEHGKMVEKMKKVRNKTLDFGKGLIFPLITSKHSSSIKVSQTEPNINSNEASLIHSPKSKRS